MNALSDQPKSLPWSYMVHTTMVDGSQTYELLDTKDEANAYLAEVIADPEVASWVCYQTLRMSDLR